MKWRSLLNPGLRSWSSTAAGRRMPSTWMTASLAPDSTPQMFSRTRLAGLSLASSSILPTGSSSSTSPGEDNCCSSSLARRQTLCSRTNRELRLTPFDAHTSLHRRTYRNMHRSFFTTPPASLSVFVHRAVHRWRRSCAPRCQLLALSLSGNYFFAPHSRRQSPHQRWTPRRSPP